MAVVKRSKQTLQTRRERSKMTHRRIVKAAYDAFCERGFAGTTMAHVAERGGVAVQTVYFVFHTKGELLSRAVALAVAGESNARSPQKSPWYQEAVEAPELRTALRAFMTGVGEIVRRLAPLSAALAGAEGDPEGAGIVAFHEEWREDGYREFIDVLLTKAPLRRGVTPQRATHLLLLYAGVDPYRLLVLTYGWTHDEWVDWTVDTIADQVFADQ